MKTKTSHTMRLLFAAAAFTSVANAQNAPVASSDEQWTFGLTVPIWAPQIGGNATAGGNTVDVDVTFNQLKQKLDKSLSLGFDARKGKLGFYGDFGYMQFSSSNTKGPLTSTGKLDFLVANAGVSYLVVKTDEEKPFSLALTAGVRYWHTDTDLTVSPTLGPPIFTGGNSQQLYQGVIGFRSSKYLTQKLHLDAAGDVGGFNISHDTDWTWSAAGLVAYDFNKTFTLSAGYKALAVNESEGSGASQKGLDVIFHGFIVAARFNF